MNIEIGAPIIEFYGNIVRIGVEGKWVEWIEIDGKRPTRKELLELIQQKDRERTH